MANVKYVAPGSRKRGRGGFAVTSLRRSICAYIKTLRARKGPPATVAGCLAHDGLVGRERGGPGDGGEGNAAASAQVGGDSSGGVPGQCAVATSTAAGGTCRV